MPKHGLISIIGCIVILFYTHGALAPGVSSWAGTAEKDHQLSLDDILDHVEKRYAAAGFSTQFYQTLTLKAMDITDTASGKAFFKRPGMMRWEYEEPDRQVIVTDSERLWIYRPEDNQVLTGKAPPFFAGGKGASFLSDMSMIRKKFAITLQDKTDAEYYVLKLVPSEKSLDITTIYINISPETFNVVQITTYNSYQDETVIELKDIQFTSKLDDALFRFNIPDGVDVLQLDE